MKQRTRIRLAVAAAVLVGALMILLLHVSGNKVVRMRNLAVLLPWLPVLVMTEWVRRKDPRDGEPSAGPDRRLPLAWLCAMLVLFLFSSIVRHRWFYFLRWMQEPTGYWLPSLGYWFALCTALLLPLVQWQPRRTARGLWLVLLVGQVAALLALWDVTQGVFIGKDDHPSFVFRLWQFRETFPAVYSYNPWWNAGNPDFHPLASGTLAPGILLWPLWKFFPVEEVYTLGFALVFIVLVPLMAACSVRALRGGLPAQAAAAILALGVSQHSYLWLLHYGTIGAGLVAALLVPAGASLYRLVVMRRTDLWTRLGVILSFFLLLCYPPGFLLALPFALSVLLQWRRWNRRVIVALLVCAAIVALLHARTLLVLFTRVDLGNVSDRSRTAFLPTPSVAVWSWEALQAGWSHVLAHLREGHPILLFFGLCALLVTPHRRLRTWYLPLVLWLAWLCGWGRFFAPHLQLSRMAIPLLFAAIVPAALHVGDILRVERLRWGLWRAALIVLLAFTALNHTRMLRNEGHVRYHPQTADHRAMSAWILDATAPAERVLFAGETVHAYGGGHVSVLPVLTGREMMASDYYHFDPGETEYEFPPRPFRASIAGWQTYLDRYNIGAVFTYHERWKQFFAQHPDVFEPAAAWGRDDSIRAYRVRRESNDRVWRGAGQASAQFDRITVSTDDGRQELILGYHWAERLTVAPPAEIFPYATEEGPLLIGLRPGGQNRVEIRFRKR